MFVRISPLLDILHCHFLHGAPWHDPPPLLYASVEKEKEKKRKERDSLLGFASDQTRLRKFARRFFCVIRAAWIRPPLYATTAVFVMLIYAKFPVAHPTAQTPGVNNRSVFRLLGPRPVPLRAPTKLPAYPSSPTPI